MRTDFSLFLFSLVFAYNNFKCNNSKTSCIIILIFGFVLVFSFRWNVSVHLQYNQTIPYPFMSSLCGVDQFLQESFYVVIKLPLGGKYVRGKFIQINIH